MKTLQKRIYKFFVLTILIFFVVIFIFLSSFYYDYNMKSIMTNNKNLLNSITYNIGTEIQILRNLSFDIIYSMERRSPLDNGIISDINKIELYDEIINILGPNLAARQINIHFDQGVSLGNGIDTKYVYQDIKDVPNYEKIIAKNGKFYLDTNVEEMKSFYGKNGYISLSSTISGKTENLFGIVVIYQEIDDFFKFVEENQLMNDYLNIVIFDNENNEVVFPVNADMENENFLAYKDLYSAIKKTSPLELNRYKDSYSQEENLFIYSKMNMYNWTVAITQPKSMLVNPIYLQILIYVVLGILLSICFFIIYNVFIKKILKPLNDLQKKVKKIDINSVLNNSISFESNNIKTLEIATLNSAFQQMYNQLKSSTTEIFSLREKENDMSYRALQAIIDPHFIYNNIATISAMAEDNKSGEVVSFCNNLCEIIRYTSNRTILQVKIKEELFIVCKYLECMKVRYKEDLEYNISIPEQLLEIVVPKLSIQTLVENSLKHGFDSNPPIVIDIFGEITDSFWKISIKDNGVGFSNIEEKRKEIDLQVDCINIDKSDIGGFGLTSVFIRMKIKCEQSFYSIENNSGAIVSIGQYFIGGSNI